MNAFLYACDSGALKLNLFEYQINPNENLIEYFFRRYKLKFLCTDAIENYKMFYLLTSTVDSFLHSLA